MLNQRTIFTLSILTLTLLSSCNTRKNFNTIACTASDEQTTTEFSIVSLPDFLNPQTQEAAEAVNLISSNTQSAKTASRGVISKYDNLMKEVGRKEGLDWRFLSAIAYHESRFIDTVESRRGAKGLMQIMPIVARQFNAEPHEMFDPELNVLIGAKLLCKIEHSLKLAHNIPNSEKMKIILACYNGGIGHVSDARRLADKYGYNKNSWEDIAYFLRLKSDPMYHDDEVVRHGAFRGSSETIGFVNSVMNKYSSYCRIA